LEGREIVSDQGVCYFLFDLPIIGICILSVKQPEEIQMNIGEAARSSGVNAKLIRHYESIGIIPKAARASSGYRTYTETEVHILAFVRRARSLGFSMKEIKKLVSLWRNKSRASSEVKIMVLTQIKQLEVKIQDLQGMVDTLKHLSRTCHGDSRPDCPILENLADQ
jgi:MerR family copper efflux transcriptional regulator